MASILDLSASSDSEDDVDYVPNGAVSDCSFEEEEVSDDDLNTGHLNGKKTTKEREDNELETKVYSITKVDEKQRANDLWASFLSDVESETSKRNTNLAVCNSSVTTDLENGSGVSTPKINTKPDCKVFEFAGETVTVDKDNLSLSELPKHTKGYTTTAPAALSKPNSTRNTPVVPVKRGIDNVLGALMNKNKKLSVLEKTSIDWKIFKKDEGLDKDLEKFNKGKQGFIERQRFLERSDARSFEVEKELRQTLRKK